MTKQDIRNRLSVISALLDKDELGAARLGIGELWTAINSSAQDDERAAMEGERRPVQTIGDEAEAWRAVRAAVDRLDPSWCRLEPLDELAGRVAALRIAVLERRAGVHDDVSALIDSIREHEPSPGARLVPNPGQAFVMLEAQIDALRDEINACRAVQCEVLSEVRAMRREAGPNGMLRPERVTSPNWRG